MSTTSERPKLPWNIVVHLVGLMLFVAGVRLLGLGIEDVFGSASKFAGAAILFFGCDELAESMWRGWRAWRSRRFPEGVRQ